MIGIEFLKVFGLTTFFTTIALTAEIIIDIRHEKRGIAQDKVGQMPWRMVAVGYGVLLANIVYYGLPRQSINILWQFWGLIGQLILAVGWYWSGIDISMAKYFKKRWYFVGTTSKIDVKYAENHIPLKIIALATGSLLILTTIVANT